MTEAAKHLRTLLTLQADGAERNNLLAAASRLSEPVQDLLNAAKDSRANHSALHAAVNAMADARTAVLECLGEQETESNMESGFLDQARNVARAVGSFVQNSCKEIARSCSDAEMQGQVMYVQGPQIDSDCFLFERSLVAQIL